MGIVSGVAKGFVGLAEDAVHFALDLVEDVTKSDAQSRASSYNEASAWEKYHAERKEHEALKTKHKETSYLLDNNREALKRRGVQLVELSEKFGCMKTERAAAIETQYALYRERDKARKERDDMEKERDAAREETKQQARKFDEWAQQKSEELAATRVTLMAARSDAGLWKEKHDAAIEARDLAVKKYDLYREHIRKAGDQINPLLQKGHERIAELKEENARFAHAINTLADFIDYVVIEEAIAVAPLVAPLVETVERHCPHYCKGCSSSPCDASQTAEPWTKCGACGKTLAP